MIKEEIIATIVPPVYTETFQKIGKESIVFDGITYHAERLKESYHMGLVGYVRGVRLETCSEGVTDETFDKIYTKNKLHQSYYEKEKRMVNFLMDDEKYNEFQKLKYS